MADETARRGRPPRRLTPDASPRGRFGAQLRYWRMRRRLTQRALAALVWHSQEFVAKVEKAERWPGLDFAARCDLALGTGGVLTRLWPAVERQRVAGDRRRRSGPGRRASGSVARPPG